jgi:uncharacterized protein YicC (UPF0701 family)
MEYKLNKIEPEVRQRIKETTSSGKVHTKTGITINQDNKNKKNKDSSDFNSELEKHKNEKKFSVDAVKVDEVEISVYKDEVENSDKDEIKGHILDVRK